MGRSKFLMVILGCLFALQAYSWDGPHSGPKAQTGKKIIFIASDLRNGGVLGVKSGFMEAIRELCWEVEVKDGGGDINELHKILKTSLRARVDGIVLGGFQPDAEMEDMIPSKHPFLVGWHAGTHPGHTKYLFANITTDLSEVAKLAAESVQTVGSKPPGIVIISDNQFVIANEKVRQITETLKKCKTCHVLSVENISINSAQLRIPELVVRLNRQFGKAWTHTVAVNDIYFDNMNFPLKEIGRNDITNIAAGDGSRVAIGRIKGGGSQQAVTVAEPLLAQGWQLADELNRAFAGKKESGFVTKPIAITKEFLDRSSSEDIESKVSFREAYSSIWKRR
ncbi:MAG: ABC transporter substrate-binding protein [Bdellovibrionales bacterium]|nr:ABC transporter substrate-binding protein [Bdellovibrionales bacterium]